MIHRLLFVDRDPNLLFIYRQYFSNAGFEVDCAATKDEAIVKLIRNKYCAIISEARLTDGSCDSHGLELARASQLIRPATTFFLLTSSMSVDLDRQARNSGVMTCWVKPKPLSVLRDALMLALDPAHFALPALNKADPTAIGLFQ